MSRSLRNLSTTSNGFLVSGGLGLVLGIVVTMNSGYSGTSFLLGYSLMALGSILMSLGIIGRFLASTAKSIVEGLGGNIDTQLPENGSSVNLNSGEFKKMF